MSSPAKKQRTTKLELAPHQVIIRPLVTEKGVHRSVRNNQYAFQVHPMATKTDIRAAIETLFNVVVDKVMTQNRKGKTRRYRNRVGTTSDWKKGIVKLNAEHRIDFF